MSAPELETELLTVDDLRTIQQVFMDLATDRRHLVERLERLNMGKQARRVAIANNQKAADHYSRIANRAGREILELEWEL